MNARLLLAVVLSALGIALAFPAAPARAHAELLASVPATGAELAAPPVEVRLTFSDHLAPTSAIQVLDGRFQDVTSGAAAVDPADPATLAVALGPLAPGEYTVQYTAVDPEDGHAVTGSFGFRVLAGPVTATASEAVAPPSATAPPQAPAPTTARPGAPTPPPARPPWFYFAVGFVAVVGMLAFSYFRRRPPPPLPPGPYDGGGA